jgi:hypothetical protein
MLVHCPIAMQHRREVKHPEGSSKFSKQHNDAEQAAVSKRRDQVRMYFKENVKIKEYHTNQSVFF